MGWSRISPLFSGEPIEQTGNPVARTGPPHSAIAVRPSAKLFRFLTLRSSRSNRRCAAPQHLPPCPDRATIIFIDLDASGASRLAAWPAPSMFLLWTVTPGQVRLGQSLGSSLITGGPDCSTASLAAMHPTHAPRQGCNEPVPRCPPHSIQRYSHVSASGPA